MRHFALLLFVSFVSLPLAAQNTCGSSRTFRVLHFTETAGFDHRTRDESAAMFSAIGADENFTVVDTRELTVFDDLAELRSFQVIIFANTSGNIPFTATQRQHLKQYVAGGGGVLGIHAATDMYRDGSFPYYTGLMGGQRRNSPAHTSNRFNGTMDVVGDHPSTAELPSTYPKQEEYYYWPDTGLVKTITPVLSVRSTGDAPYDAPRPISWFQEFGSGGRSFYTGLGHAAGNYTEPNNNFRLHLRDALCWAVAAESASLPIEITSVGLERGKRVDRVWYQVYGELPSTVELHGGYAQTEAGLLTRLTGASRFSGALEHTPTDRVRWFYYRLRFTDFSGIATWSPWLTAPPLAEPGARPRVQYADGGATLAVPKDGPQAAWIIDANGRRMATLSLGEGTNTLPNLTPGVYFIRFPFGTETLRWRVR
ncbi:ThuA domain-containing protein [Neolewinella antarctica]|uniref:Type 1 glutamine amidotransferase n=1 Tax=Neolewinella antarctica TaxID=442734 RepID=A0ABX0XAI1_9BACT|nr:ThuA domain-containing protein [Neolewinella antarctica]NJC25949.1 type 1 glutamine amidotransferase [Neolewinella antarctica]